MTRSYYWPQQSPINLSKISSYFVDFPKSPLEIKYQGEYSGSFQEHNGRLDFVLDKNQEGNRRPEIVFNCKTAVLKKIHLHMKSEHNLALPNGSASLTVRAPLLLSRSEA